MVVSSWVKRSIIGLGGCIGLGVGRSQIVLPGSQYVQNLTQTVKDSWILDTNGQPLIRLHDTSADSSNRISIPPGALRDQSVVADDIDRSTAPAGETYDCGSGILRGVESDGRVSCGSYAVGGSLWESTDEGQASIYYGTTTQSDIVSVGSHPSLIPLSANFSEGVYASGDIQTQTSLVRGDGVMELTAPGTYLVSAPRGGVLAWLGVAQAADPVDAAVLAHRVPLAIGQVFLNPAYSTPASVGVAKTDPQQGLDVGGDAIIDGALYLRSGDARGAVWVSHLVDGSWISTKQSSGSSVFGMIAPRVVIGRQESTSAPIEQTDAQLDVLGTMSIQDGVIDFSQFGPDAPAVGQLLATSDIPAECVALSLDDQGYVVLVNICAGGGYSPLDDFVTTWETTTAGESITIPTSAEDGSNYVYNYDLDCDNDGVFEQTGLTRDATCTYATPGLHTVRITGQFPHFYLFNDDYSRLHLQPNHSDNYLIPNEHPFMDGPHKQLRIVNQRGSIQWKSMRGSFFCAACDSNALTNTFSITAADLPNLSQVTDMSFTFSQASRGIGAPNINSWNTSNIQFMTALFAQSNFDQSISSRDTTSVVNMDALFWGSAFDQDISSRCVSQISSEPSYFSDYSPLIASYKPVRGTCP